MREGEQGPLQKIEVLLLLVRKYLKYWKSANRGEAIEAGDFSLGVCTSVSTRGIKRVC